MTSTYINNTNINLNKCTYFSFIYDCINISRNTWVISMNRSRLCRVVTVQDINVGACVVYLNV